MNTRRFRASWLWQGLKGVAPFWSVLVVVFAGLQLYDAWQDGARGVALAGAVFKSIINSLELLTLLAGVFFYNAHLIQERGVELIGPLPSVRSSLVLLMLNSFLMLAIIGGVSEGVGDLLKAFVDPQVRRGDMTRSAVYAGVLSTLYLGWLVYQLRTEAHGQVSP